MSQMEMIIWYVLGYATMPSIFIVGFAATAAVWCFLQEKLNK